jgi:3-hydroxybutyryl-CoA dehydratase
MPQMGYAIKKFEEFKIGEKGVCAKTITEADVILFAGVSGDFNPVHINEEYAKTTMFKGRIVHGMLVASLLGQAGASILGGAIYLGHSQRFLAPVKTGDTITASFEIIEMIPEKKLIKCHGYCTNQDGKVVIDGEATVKVIA